MIRIAFSDWWGGFDKNDNFICRALKDSVDFEIISDSTNVDFLFCSIFGNDFLNYSCPRIFFTGENCVPDFNLFDYAIGFDNIAFNDRYIRLPLYAASFEEDCQAMNNRPAIVDAFNREFCSMVVTNVNFADDYREKLFFELSKKQFVASGGRYLNNIGIPEGVADKNSFLRKFKFNIACENASHIGYCTEKIVQAFAACTIPIYWGDPDVNKYFNPKAFINCNDFDSISDVVNYVLEIDSDEQKYLDMLNQPAIINKEYEPDFLYDQFQKWLCQIVTQDKAVAYRRTTEGWAKANEIRKQKADKFYYAYEKTVNGNSLFSKVMRHTLKPMVEGSISKHK